MAEPGCTIVGILDDGWEGLAETARRRLSEADLVIGSRRTLALVRPHLPPQARLQPLEGELRRLPGRIAAARESGQWVAVLATGDPLCHGIASYLTRRLEGVEVLPAPSTVQLACARFRRPVHEYRIASCHGRDAGEWQAGATPDHGLYAVMRAVALHPRVAVFTGPENDPARLARALLTAGLGEAVRLSVACRLLRPDEALFPGLTPGQAAAMTFPDPNVVLLERDADPLPLFGLEEEAYARRCPAQGLITRLEARALSLAKLRIRPGSLVWDIGAGSGSVGLEAARLARHGHVWAIEKNPEDAANARENARRLRATNYTLVEGRAPERLAGWPDPDAVFVGGSGGELEALVALILERLRPGGRLVMNLVTLENLAAATAALAAAGAPWEVVQLQAARSRPIRHLHRLAAQNPVWIVSAQRSGVEDD